MIIEIRKPELEGLIRERMISGGYTSVEDVLMQALLASVSQRPTATSGQPKKPLGQFLLESPLGGSGLKLEHQRDYPSRLEL